MRSALFIFLSALKPPWRLQPGKILLVAMIITCLSWAGWRQAVKAADASCAGSPITVPNVEKKLISPTGGSRPGHCIKPDLIFIHSTNDPSIDAVWSHFNTGSEGEGTNAQFIVGTDGTVLQTVELYDSVTEYAKTNSPMNDRSIGIEMVGPLEFADKADVPTAQYNATLQLVQFLMSQYTIPIGEHEADWKSCENNDPITAGVYGHYQLCTTGHSDPGQQMLADFRTDLKASGSPGSTTNPSVMAGRWVPYDKYARPYSWPVSGIIRQNYGFTDEAQNLGERYPNLYPSGDPGVIFSTTNHVVPPPNKETDKYINPNIDIAPRSNDPLARAVYSTQAGWITYADWAGEGKGYTIQVESDVDGDGQADLATRYMRLQAPEGGYFAPDIALFHPAASNGSTGTTNGACTVPANADWADVNKWDTQVQQGISEIMSVDDVEVPCNLVKAFMKLESGGVELEPNSDGYLGLMQVGDRNATGGGSDCDLNKYNVHTTQGNITCGIQAIAHAYQQCDSWDGAILRYFTGSCTGGSGGPDAFGTTPDQYLASVKDNWTYLDSQLAKTEAPAVPDPSTQTTPQPTSQDTATSLPPAYILEAEAMDIGTVASTINDTTASGQHAVAFLSNGSVSAQIKQKADRLVVTARGDYCGDWPELVLKIDGQEFYRTKVTSTEWTTLATTAPFDGSNHVYSIEFTNNFQIASGLVCDRNLYVDTSRFEVTNPNTSESQTLDEATIEAESLKTRTTTKDTDPEDTVPAATDEPASGDKYVRFVDNSTIKGTASFSGMNWIKVRARGTACEGGPHMVVKIDGAVVLEVDVDTETWMDYSTQLNLTEASKTEHDIEIIFSNDKFSSPFCDRNLEVDVITLQNNTVSQTPNNANSLIGKTKYVGFNQLLGYVSVARDREHAGSDLTQIPNANQTYLSYRIMYNNPNFTTFPLPDEPDAFINARVDNPYIIETADNTVAGSLKVAWDNLAAPLWFFCALRVTGNSVLCVDAPNPY